MFDKGDIPSPRNVTIKTSYLVQRCRVVFVLSAIYLYFMLTHLRASTIRSVATKYYDNVESTVHQLYLPHLHLKNKLQSSICN